MSATDAVHEFMAALEVEEGTTVEELAEQMFYWQMEIYSSHAGSDLYSDGDYERLSDKNRASWLGVARKKLAGELT